MPNRRNIFFLIAFSLSLISTSNLYAGPPSGPGSSGPASGGPLEIIAQTVAGKVCLTRCSNRVQQCVASCPEPQINIENPDMKGPQCMFDCMTTFVSCYEAC